MPSLRNLHKLLDSEIRRKNLRALKLELRGLYWDLRRPQVPDPVFIVGCSRSGTTVTYETVAAAPSLLSFNYEIPSFWNSLSGPPNDGWASEAADASDARPEHRERALRYFFQHLGQGRVLDKTCINVMRIPYLYKLFPEATFIYIHRDGRDNISSMMDGWRHDGHFGLTKFLGPFPEPVAIDGGRFTEWSFFLPPGWRDYNQASLEEVCAFQWVSANRLALEAKKDIPARQWIQLRYEQIFDDPVAMFRPVFERLEIPFDSELEARCSNLNRRPTSIVQGMPKKQKWKSRNPEAIERILEVIEPTMRELGYDIHD
ncbi:MAG TPA: sulfotransferase [Chromatiaceae bacterium]|nr:sulfotransferase [Chromatiaceae bacterium]